MDNGPQGPVTEVVLSATLTRQSALVGPLLSEILGEWFTAHKHVQTVPPYQMPPELEGFGGIIPGPRFEILDEVPDHRFWLISSDQTELIQIQPAYAGLNWRKREEAETYPRYEQLREKFVSLLGQLKEGLEPLGGALNLQRSEITYVNLIRPNELWSDHSETHLLFDMPIPRAAYERAGFSYSRRLEQDGEFKGRLHVTLKPAVDWAKREPVLSLTLTARSSEPGDGSIADVVNFLDFAHERITEAFLDLLTDRAKATWGFEE